MNQENEIIQPYREWILKQENEEFTVRQDPKNSDRIALETSYASGEVLIHKLDQFSIAELRLTSRKDGQTVFYLHFELRDLVHAKELFREMILCLNSLKDRQKTRIIICCTSALTSSYFAEKMNETAAFMNQNEEFRAVSYDRLFEEGFESDLVLLAPQISFLYKKASAALKNTKVVNIPAHIFGTYDAEGMLELVHASLKEKQSEPLLSTGKTQPVHGAENVLIIAVICEFDTLTMKYRIYNHGKAVLENRIIKKLYSLSDIDDIADVAVKSGYSFDTVCVLTPGVINEGRLTFKSQHIYHYEVQKRLEKRLHKRIIICNDANAMALGFYNMQNQYQNICFYFHPHAARKSGVGTVRGGELITGSHNIAGEMQYLADVISFSEDPSELVKTLEGSLEMVSKYLTAVIACIDPEAIAISCDMIPDTEDLRRKLEECLSEDMVPDLIKIDDVTEYMFAGGLSLLEKR
jgi:cellobiose-specific phosphotransferase system component IIB